MKLKQPTELAIKQLRSQGYREVGVFEHLPSGRCNVVAIGHPTLEPMVYDIDPVSGTLQSSTSVELKGDEP